MSRRYYSAAPLTGPQATLDGPEAHHRLHVLRAQPGAQATLFDGSGCEFDAEVTACRRSTVELTITARREVDRELPAPSVLGVPLPKGDRQRWLVEKAVELGVTRLVPLRTEHSTEHGARPAGKLDRYVIEASKQCGRNRLMEITELRTWEQWLTLAGEADEKPLEARRLVAHFTGQPRGAINVGEARPTYAAVGPEGGFTDAEIAAATAAGWKIASLGPRILRVETAAVFLATAAAMTSVENSRRTEN